jgi:hypothetical protein
MARAISSISRTGTTEPFELQVSRGQIAWHSTLYKFGFNSVVGIPEKTDVEARAISSSGDQSVAATFEGVLIRNGDSF